MGNTGSWVPRVDPGFCQRGGGLQVGVSPCGAQGVCCETRHFDCIFYNFNFSWEGGGGGSTPHL